MQFKISALVVFLFLSLNCFSQAKVEYGIIEFDILFQNAGEIPEGPNHIFEFKFKNISKTPILLSRVKSSCGCLVPYWPKEPVMPGETGIIKGVYNTKNRPGYFQKTMTVVSNAKIKNNDRENIVLMMKGHVLEAPKKAEEPKK